MRAFIIAFVLIAMNFVLCGLEYVPNEMIIKTSAPREIYDNKTGIKDFDNFLSEKSLKNIKPIFRKTQDQYFVISFNNELIWENIENLSFTGIEYIQPNYINTLCIIPDDPEYNKQQQNFENVSIPEAWNYTTGNGEIIISVMDSGINFDHPDLQTNIFINEDEIPDDGIDNDSNGYIDDWHGWDFVDAPELYDMAMGDYLDQDNDPSDELNHGTHIAGIISADTNNNKGISGICWNIKLLVIRAGFLSIDGYGYLQDDDAAAGIIYASDMGADIINLSWGDENFSQIIADACYYAYERGSIIVVSSGNTYGPDIMYPAILSTTISVGSVDKYLERASFSSYGPALDLVAPGVNIISTYNVSGENTYYEQSGTSVSAPFVSACLGLLLSLEPGLNFEQVRARLNSSTIDLGEPGFDNEYGNGLLDAYSLLTTTSYPVIEISYPPEFSGLSESFDIIGSVTAPDFSRYSVMYTTEQEPTILDWKDVSYPHNNTPVFYEYEVENDVLANFDIREISPEFDSYILKVEVITNSNQHYSFNRTIFIDQTESVFADSLSSLIIRYEDENPVYYLTSVFDEPVDICINWSPLPTLFYSDYSDPVQVIRLEDIWSPEPISIQATNLCGFETNSQFYHNTEDISQEEVDTHNYNQTLLGNELVAAREVMDIDNNGKNEFLALEILDEEENLKILEFDGDELITKYIFPFQIWPYDIGNTNESYIEILGLSLDIVCLYESDYSNLYPNNLIWVETNVYGGNFIDYDYDGIDEIALIRNETIDQTTKRVLSLYKRTGNFIIKQYTILNETQTDLKNEFVNKIECGNLDGDPFPDILVTDTDGDIMIFEKENGAENFEMVWNIRLPVENTYYFAIGDFTGDGNNEFCVGGYNRNFSNPLKTFSFFEFYANNNENNQYLPIGYVCFNQVESKNSIANTDLDGDGDEEIVLSVPPNTYIIDYVENKFIPVWKGNSSKTYQNVIVALPQTENEVSHIIVNLAEEEDINSSLIIKSEDFSGPPSPLGFKAQPVDSITILLNWHHSSSADYYKIYKKSNNEAVYIDSTYELEYLDTNLTAGDTLFYRITTVNDDYTPEESLPTLWKEAIPYYVPEINLIEMISYNLVKILFTQKLSNNAINTNHFEVNNEIGKPVSVNFINEKKGLILSFRKPFEDYDNYFINIIDLTGQTGVPFPDGYYYFEYNEDTTPPKILSATVWEDKKTVKISFTEAVKSSLAQDISHYTLILPEIDQENGIENIHYFEESGEYYVNLLMGKKLEYTNQSYFLKIDNIEDIAGNKITNDGNKCCFSLTDISNLDYLIVYPNPLNANEIDGEEDFVFRFINLPMGKEGKIYIYNLSGELVFEDNVGPYYNSIDFYSWNAKNKSNKKVSSGMYFYIIKMGNDLKKGKIAVIN